MYIYVYICKSILKKLEYGGYFECRVGLNIYSRMAVRVCMYIYIYINTHVCTCLHVSYDCSCRLTYQFCVWIYTYPFCYSVILIPLRPSGVRGVWGLRLKEGSYQCYDKHKLKELGKYLEAPM